MNKRVTLLAAATLAVALSISLAAAQNPFSRADRNNRHQVSDETTHEDLVRWFTEFSSRGRWENVGLGAANLITRAKRRAAAKLVRAGISVSMAHNVPQEPCSGPPNSSGQPTCIGDQDNTYLKRTVLSAPGSTFISDRYEYQGTYHGATHSHLDALGCHVHYQGEGWANLSTEVTQEVGCPEEKGGITAFRNGIFTRGVLIDIARFKGKQWLEAGEGATYKDVRDWERWSGVRIRSGDAVFLRTGRWARQAALGVPYSGGNPGWHASVIPLFHQRDVSYIGSDHINDVLPAGITGTTDFVLPVHQIVMPSMGINIMDNLDLEEIAELAHRLRRYEFLVTVGPLRIDKGLGSPANPIATF